MRAVFYSQERLPTECLYNKTYAEYTIESSTIKLDDVPTMKKVGEWTSKKEFHFTHDLFPNSFNGFNNRKFKVASLAVSTVKPRCNVPAL